MRTPHSLPHPQTLWRRCSTPLILSHSPSLHTIQCYTSLFEIDRPILGDLIISALKHTFSTDIGMNQ